MFVCMQQTGRIDSHFQLSPMYICKHMCIVMISFPGPDPPTDVSVAVMDRDTVVVSWTASQSRMCDVAIVIYSVKYELNFTGDYTTAYTSVTLHGLTPEYSVSVAAINSIGNMNALSAVRNFHTFEPEVTPGETHHQ